MKVIENIHKMIFIKVGEIILVLFFMLLANSLYNSEYNKNNLNLIANSQYVSPVQIFIKNKINYSMFPMSDEKALQKLKPCIVTISNETYKTEEYSLILKIEGISELESDAIRLGIDDVIYSLKDFEKKVIDGQIVYTLNKNTIVASKKDYQIRLWVNEINKNSKINDLVTEFDILHGKASV